MDDKTIELEKQIFHYFWSEYATKHNLGLVFDISENGSVEYTTVKFPMQFNEPLKIEDWQSVNPKLCENLAEVLKQKSFMLHKIKLTPVLESPLSNNDKEQIRGVLLIGMYLENKN